MNYRPSSILGQVMKYTAGPRFRRGAFVFLILACAVAPRAAALWGVRFSSELAFADMPLHLNRLDIQVKRWWLSAEQNSDPYFRTAPQKLAVQTPRWPAGLTWAAMPLSRAFGPLSIWTTQLTNLLFTLILVGGVIGLGVALDSWRTGLWGALLTVLCPPLVGGSWYFGLDYPLAAMVTMGLFLLWRTRGFSRAGPSLVFGLWSTAGLFIKLPYAIYLLLPSIWTAGYGLTTGRGRRPRILGLVAATLGLTGALTFWLHDLDPARVVADLAAHVTRVEAGEEFPLAQVPAWTLEWLFALARMAAVSFPWPLLLLCLPGLAALHLRWRQPVPPLLITFLWGSYVLLTLISQKMERYSYPVYPVLCLLGAFWVFRWIPARWMTTAMCWVAVTFGVILYMSHQSPPPWPRGATFSTGEDYTDTPMISRSETRRLRRLEYHTRCDWRELVEQMTRLTRATSHRGPLGVLFDNDPAPTATLRTALDSERLTPLTAQVVRDRFVFPVGRVEPTYPPQVLFVHHPETPPVLGQPPRSAVAHRAAVTFSCGPERGRLVVSLLRMKPRHP